MTNEETRPKRMKWWYWWILAGIVLILILNLGLFFSGVKDESSASAATAAPITAATLSTATPQQLDSLLSTAAVREEDSVDVGLFQAPSLGLTTHCHGQVWRKLIIYLRYVGTQIAWRRALKHEWCWIGSVITSWGVNDKLSYKEWTFPGYCWYNTAPGDNWYERVVRHHERLIENGGTLRTCVRLSLQRTINPKVYYQAGGTYNKG